MSEKQVTIDEPVKFDIRNIPPISDGEDLVIGSYRIKNIDKYELNIVLNKYGAPIGLVIAPEGTNYAETENKKDIHNWIDGNFTNNFFDECINKNEEIITLED